MSKRGLGRGLDALLEEEVEQGSEEGEVDRIQEIPVDRLRIGAFQPRRELDEEALQELADSIQTQGVVQPLVVRAQGDGSDYELIAGERRWRAAQKAGLNSVPALVRGMEDHQALEIALIENIQREQLTPIEEALAFSRLLEEFGLTHDKVARQVGRKRSSISNTLRLLRLPENVQKALDVGDLRMGHARALLGLEGHTRLPEVAQDVINRGLSVRATEELVRKLVRQEEAPEEEEKGKDPDVERLENRLSENLGTRVRIKQGKKRGRLEIEYTSLDELEGLINRIH